MLRRFVATLLLSLAALQSMAAETVLQYFNTSWKEIERRIPELAEAGYDALWLPPPTKGASGGFSVGYDPLNRFDLGDTSPTRYGTKADLIRLIELAHRFGIRVYLDNVMAHNAGPLDDVASGGTIFPGFRASFRRTFIWCDGKAAAGEKRATAWTTTTSGRC